MLAPPVFARTDDVDRQVIARAEEFLAGCVPEPFALLAVGGYGRRELFPFSDVDLVVLLDREPDQAKIKEPLGRFLSRLWDAGIKASHSVRTVDECCHWQEGNQQLSISLLDARKLWGTEALFVLAELRMAAFFNKNASQLLRSLAEMTSARHAKFGHTVYHLEPNIKEGPGGMRDIHFLRWASLLDPDRESFRHAVSEAEGARAFLYALRFFLHERSGRDNNLLSFELQDEAAIALSPSLPSAEQWMREFYRNARVCFRLTEQVVEFISRRKSGLVRQFMDRQDRLSTADYTVSHNQVFLRNPANTLRSLPTIFELFAFVARQGVPIAWDTERRLRERAVRHDALRWADWSPVLQGPHAALALRNMADSQVLAAVLPEWRAIESLVVRDFYHRYTVDEHTLVAIETIDGLAAGASGEADRFRDLASEESNLAAVRLALLLHDIGKGTAPGDHVRCSLEAAAEYLVQLELPESEKRTIEFLIGNHLVLANVMTRRDLDDPATGRFLSATAGTYEDLRKLTLLTYADISAVNPTALTPWRAEQLWRVHSVAAGQLTRDLDAERIRSHGFRDASEELPPAVERFLEGFPTRYLRIHSKEEIQEHMRLDGVRAQESLALELKREPGAYALTVLTNDQPGLFAALCGTLASFGLNIVKAEAASNAAGVALDEFHFTDPGRTLELNPDEVARFRSTLCRVIKGSVEAADLLKARRPARRPSAADRLRPSVRFDDDASDSATLMHFTGNDRPGLLFDLASALKTRDCNIELVLVDTEAHRAIDVFYVTKSGSKLDAETQKELILRLAPEA